MWGDPVDGDSARDWVNWGCGSLHLVSNASSFDCHCIGEFTESVNVCCSNSKLVALSRYDLWSENKLIVNLLWQDSIQVDPSIQRLLVPLEVISYNYWVAVVWANKSCPINDDFILRRRTVSSNWLHLDRLCLDSCTDCVWVWLLTKTTDVKCTHLKLRNVY
jgi:hypothetical protein